MRKEWLDMIKNTVHAPAWTSLTPAPKQYAWLDQDITCQVAVVGGGISAAMIALRFAQAGLDTVMISESPLGYGATAVSSGIMTLSGGECLTCLADEIGPERAMTAARLMAEALDNVEKLCASFTDSCGFRRMDSLRYVEKAEEAVKIRREYSLRLHNGMEVELLDSVTGSQQFTFPMEAGLYAKNAAAQVNPYRLVHGVAAAAAEAGAKIYENTSAETLDESGEEAVVLECANGRTIRADYVIMASGMEMSHLVKGIDEVRTTYMVVTEPVAEFPGWRGPCVIHREGEPRLYCSVTGDGRILIGGLDSYYMDEKGRVAGVFDMSPAMDKRFDSLAFTLREMFPAIPNITAEYVFAAQDAATKDTLPIIGRLPDSSRVAYALCCGDNGILSAEIAGRLLLQQYQGVDDHELGLFSPGRAWRVKR